MINLQIIAVPINILHILLCQNSILILLRQFQRPNISCIVIRLVTSQPQGFEGSYHMPTTVKVVWTIQWSQEALLLKAATHLTLTSQHFMDKEADALNTAPFCHSKCIHWRAHFALARPWTLAGCTISTSPRGRNDQFSTSRSLIQ